MASSMLTGEKRWNSARRSRMTVLGKVTVPKPINLPSQRLENHGLDPNVKIVLKGTTSWGIRSASSASNAWGSSTLSPSADGGPGSPNHLNLRPSSGGSVTRPSTAGSDKFHEPVVNAWGSHSRPSSASGELTSSHPSLLSLRPHSTETRPGSSQLSRFGEPLSDNSVTWTSSGTSNVQGTNFSKNDGFSSTYGNFPVLGSEKETPGRIREYEDHRPLSRHSSLSGFTVSGKKGTGKEETRNYMGGVFVNENVKSQITNTWRGKDGLRPKNWHAEPHPFPNSNIPTQHYDAWHGPPVNSHLEGVWYRGPPRAPTLDSQIAARGFPMDHFPYYCPQIHPPALVNPQPGAGPRGPHSMNGNMYRPHVHDGYIRSGIPRMGFFNTINHEVPYSSGDGGPVAYNRHISQNAPDPRNSHGRSSGYNPSNEAPIFERLKSMHSQDARGSYGDLSEQQDSWDADDEAPKWNVTKRTAASNPVKKEYPRKMSSDNMWREHDGNQRDKTVCGEAFHDAIGNRGAPSMMLYVRDGSLKAPAHISGIRLQSRADYESPAFPEESPKDPNLKRKVEGLNANYESYNGHCDLKHAPTVEEQKYKVHGGIKIDLTAKEAGTHFVPNSDMNNNNTTDSHAPCISAGEKGLVSTVPSGTTTVRSSSCSMHGRADHGKEKFNTHETDDWCKKSQVEDSFVRMDVNNESHNDHNLTYAEVNEKPEANPQGVSEPNDTQEQRAKMIELAKQRIKLREMEEEERLREQKAKALAKLEELNRRTQAREGINQKLEAASNSATQNSSESFTDPLVPDLALESNPSAIMQSSDKSADSVSNEVLLEELRSSCNDESLLQSISDPDDTQEKRAKMIELAKQRIKEREKEEEERVRAQKAKALAKLEELNRRTQRVEQKLETAPNSVMQNVSEVIIDPLLPNLLIHSNTNGVMQNSEKNASKEEKSTYFSNDLLLEKPRSACKVDGLIPSISDAKDTQEEHTKMIELGKPEIKQEKEEEDKIKQKAKEVTELEEVNCSTQATEGVVQKFETASNSATQRVSELSIDPLGPNFVFGPDAYAAMQDSNTSADKIENFSYFSNEALLEKSRNACKDEGLMPSISDLNVSQEQNSERSANGTENFTYFSNEVLLKKPWSACKDEGLIPFISDPNERQDQRAEVMKLAKQQIKQREEVEEPTRNQIKLAKFKELNWHTQAGEGLIQNLETASNSSMQNMPEVSINPLVPNLVFGSNPFAAMHCSGRSANRNEKSTYFSNEELLEKTGRGCEDEGLIPSICGPNDTSEQRAKMIELTKQQIELREKGGEERTRDQKVKEFAKLDKLNWHSEAREDLMEMEATSDTVIPNVSEVSIDPLVPNVVFGSNPYAAMRSSEKNANRFENFSYFSNEVLLERPRNACKVADLIPSVFDRNETDKSVRVVDLAKQGVKQREQELEKPARGQKAQKVAKLEESNSHPQVKDGLTKKLERASNNSAMRNVPKVSLDPFVPNLVFGSIPCTIKSIERSPIEKSIYSSNEVLLEKPRSACKELVVENNRSVPFLIDRSKSGASSSTLACKQSAGLQAHVSDSHVQKFTGFGNVEFSMTQKFTQKGHSEPLQQVDIADDSEISSSAGESNNHKHKHLTYKQKHSGFLDNSLVKVASFSSDELSKTQTETVNKSDTAVEGVANVVASKSEANMSTDSSASAEPSLHQRRKNRIAKSKQKLEDASSSVTSPAAMSTPTSALDTRIGSIKPENSEFTHSSDDMLSLQNEDRVRSNNQFRPQYSHRISRSLQAHRSAQKFQRGNSVVWAPVRVQNKMKVSYENSTVEISSMWEQPRDSDDNGAADGWNVQGKQSGSVSVTVEKDQGMSSRGKQQLHKGQKGGYHYNYVERRNGKEGDKDKAYVQSSASDMCQTDLLAASKGDCVVGKIPLSHWQPKSGLLLSGSQQDNAAHIVASELGMIKKVESAVPLSGVALQQPDSDATITRAQHQHNLGDVGRSDYVEVSKSGLSGAKKERKIARNSHPEDQVNSSVSETGFHQASSGFRISRNQGNHFGRSCESRGDRWSVKDHKPNTISVNREKQRQNLHYEYQPVGQQTNNTANNSRTSKDGSQNLSARLKGRGQGRTKHCGGNF